ncbi:hypothetical protein J3R82DRAFT_5602 [Butyriboletus roseoflavus]|nr:hypothetical protein J3R82DRAFT_5602 [Butyriboletus roseoflavus]
MLYNEHIKAGRDLERRIAKLREENKDPTLPQKMSPAQMHAEHNSSAPSGGSTSFLPSSITSTAFERFSATDGFTEQC